MNTNEILSRCEELALAEADLLAATDNGTVRVASVSAEHGVMLYSGIDELAKATDKELVFAPNTWSEDDLFPFEASFCWHGIRFYEFIRKGEQA